MARRRRFHYDTLVTVNEPRWLKSFDQYARETSCVRVEPGSDLRAKMREVANQLAADGWIIEGDGPESWTGTFYANRIGERQFLCMVPTEKPTPAHGTPCTPGGWDWDHEKEAQREPPTKS